MTSIHGTEGDDSLTADDYGSYVFGLDGNDTLATGDNSTVFLVGGTGDDLYIINWESATADNTHWMTVTEANGGHGSSDGNDTIDISAIVGDGDTWRFGGGSTSSGLQIAVYDQNGNRTSTIVVESQYTATSAWQVENLVVNGETYDLTAATSGARLNSQVFYGATTGNDVIVGDAVADFLHGLDGDDTITASSRDRASIWGGNGDDLLYVNGYDQKVYGEDGDDTLIIGDFDSVYADAGAGNDNLVGSIYDDHMIGGLGDDTLRGNDGHDVLYGYSGNDQIWAGAGDQGNDSLYGGAGNDTLGGGAGDDILIGDSGTDILYGGAGDDILYGKTESSSSETESNQIWAGSGDDIVKGADGGDALGGGTGNDRITGGDGNDVIYAGKSGADTLKGAGGNDAIFGGTENDLIDGGAGADEIYGGSGDDIVNGGSGDDTLYGGSGDDTLTGGTGNDTLRGGDGADLFIFESGDGIDVVGGFSLGEDTLDLSATATDFTDLASVQAAASESNDGLLIDLGGGDSVLLQGLSLADLVDMSLLL
ncbi:MAG: hypothetical protein HWE25_02610 [Alphaproteobacteria bacterium]|nr:hypothetical protein [Alphaproteobacteria bacterium]